MQVEPDIDPPRDTEALLIVVDASVPATGPSGTFADLRDAAERMARTRLISSTAKDDLIGVLKVASTVTANKLAEQTPGGYGGIEILHPQVSKSLAAVAALHNMTSGIDSCNLLNLLDVAGDLMVQPAAQRSSRKRMVLFTDGAAIVASLSEQDHPDLEATSELYKEHSIQVDVICHCSPQAAEDLLDYEEKFLGVERPSGHDCIQLCDGFQHAYLLAVSKATGGVFLPYSEATSLVDRPIAKVKRAVAKFRGVLNIGEMLKIPVKRFSHVSSAKVPTAKKLSWDVSVARKEPVSVLVETQKVASARDDTPLQPEDIVNAYPYGPELVPEQNEVDTYAWSINMPKGLDALGFVRQDSVPHRLFMGPVDVIIPMSGVEDARLLMKNLVQAMHANELGILARYVQSPKGGAPRLCYLWPRVELGKRDDAVRNCFLFIVEVPMREDIREIRFANLEQITQQIPESANLAMERYISSSMLDGDNEMEGEEEDDSLWPPNECNPNIDRFNVAVVHRAMEGVAGTGFPPLSEWQRKITDPSSFIRDDQRESFNQAIRDLKTMLPVMPVRQKEKRGRIVHQALSGDLASIVDYLPADQVEDGSESEEDNTNAPDLNAFDDNISVVTDIDIIDVGSETPVTDFQNLVKQGKFRFAAASLLVIVRRLIRDLVDDEKAMRCLQALRKASLRLNEHRLFNDFVISMVERCTRKNADGNRTEAFFRFVCRRSEIATALEIIPLPQLKDAAQESSADSEQRAYLKQVSARIATLAAEKTCEPSTSVLSM